MMSAVRDAFGGSADEDDTPTFEEVGRDEYIDDLLFLLKNSRRRQIIHYLFAHDEGNGVTLDTLATEIAAYENDVEVGEVTSNQRKRVYVGLYQEHLPRLDAEGIVEFDDHRAVRVHTTDETWEYNSAIESMFTIFGGDGQ